MSEKVERYKKTKTIPERIKAMAAVHPDKLVEMHGNRSFTWKEFNERTNALSNALLDFGAKKGDLCAIMLPNIPEFIETMYACAKIGVLPCCGINTRYKPKEIIHVINESLAGDPRFLVLDEDFADKIREVRQEVNINNYIVVGKNVPRDMLSYDDLINKYPKTNPKFDWEIKPDDDGIILMTGGTTGYPKGVVWTNEDYLLGMEELLLTSLLGQIEVFRYLSKETIEVALKMVMPPLAPLISSIVAPILRTDLTRRLLSNLTFQKFLFEFISSLAGRGFPTGRLFANLRMMPLSPLFHGAANYAVDGVIQVGGAAVFPTIKIGFDPKDFCESVEKWKVNACILVGDTMMRPLVEYIESIKGKYDLSSLMLVSSSGGGVTGHTRGRLTKLLPQVIITDSAGTTEASVFGAEISAADLSKEEENLAAFGKLGTKILGRTRVVNPETWKDIKPGEVGVVIVGGGQHMSKCYYKDPERSKQFWRVIDGERWFNTGDEATIDENGVFSMYGRMSGIINTGGEKVYPEEVESIMKKHPKIENVAITGVPDEKWGQAVAAVIKIKKGENADEKEIIEWCRDKMAGYKRPKYVIFTDDIPLSSTGKAEKPKLKAMATIYVKEGRMPTKEELDEAMLKGKKI